MQSVVMLVASFRMNWQGEAAKALERNAAAMAGESSLETVELGTSR
jgi:hypothetical protein